ncbi:hypothetical protein Nepgr_008388 [Nepenthes gracilis]|uniref:DNA-(apurinic or apyrimidinic site) endonuclease 2 n=1 Tax=Nepenthes gracilis TaxID=150966 RepID=A0AAD3S8V1_NEPGR|nr:hypothetical protein Nepgr_008388 [Nepenthes gracilis]
MLKIVTYNVNGLRQRISQSGSLLKLLSSLDADIICFQEIKLTRQELTADLIMAEGYESFFSCTRTSGRGRTGYSGVATFCRVKSAFSSNEVALPMTAEEGFTGLLERSLGSETRNAETLADMQCLKEFTRDELLIVDSEGRCIITDHGHFVLFNVYGPRADSDDAERIKFKTNFFKILQKRWELLLHQGRRVFVVGDLNIAPAAIDRCDAGPDFEHNEFRRWFRSLLVKNGGAFFDIFREKNPERKDAYTFWPVHTGAEEFNYGTRIDHILAGGLCLHEEHDQPSHSLVACHVKESDIMTQFRRWKPGITPRWKGGRSAKLEGSDHVPVYMLLKEIPDILLHNTPSLSARYIPEIRGSQQTIVSLLMKRQVAEQVSVSQVASSLSDENNKKLTACGSVKQTFQDFTVSTVHYGECSSFNLDAGEGDPNGLAPGGHENSRSLTDAGKKKKAKPNQPSQLSLRSFFQKVPNLGNGGCHSAKDDVLHNQADFCKSNDDHLKRTSDLDEKSSTGEKADLSICASAMVQRITTAPLEEDKNTALLEWRNIQQRMQDSIPLCDGHHEPCVARVVKKQGPNFGRRFYVCARAEGPASNPETRCGFFRWAASKSRHR